ncbi:MAG: molybdopterin-dependent oxidoreductase [Planctomycetaceae bacterium]
MNRSLPKSIETDSRQPGFFLSRRNWLQSLIAAGASGLLLTGTSRGEAPMASTSSLPKGLIIHTASPPNAEPPLDQLLQNWITPVDRFYVRSHAPQNPEVDIAAWRLTVDGQVEKPLSLSLAELKEKFPTHEVTATLCCAGNRRDEMIRIKPIEGVPWQAGALGNAKWGGVRLADVLKYAGLQGGGKHVWFEGLDRHDKKGESIVFGGSIPVDRVMAGDPAGDVLIATTMNGQPLNSHHGAPARTLVPGFIGARSVKWLSKIHVADRPSYNHYVAHAYRLVYEETPAAWERADIIYDLPLQSVIVSAKDETNKQRTRLVVKGYAYSGGDAQQKVARVEVSINGGQSWTTARITSQVRPYCWQFWTAEIAHRKPVEQVLCRAIDASWRMQPEKTDWNPKGYMQHGWHSAKVTEG